MKRAFASLLLAAMTAAGCSEDSGDASTAPRRVHAVSQNILHGTNCVPETDRCALPDRIDLFMRQLNDGQCPELVGLQEGNGDIVELIETRLPQICGGRYTIVHDDDASTDREVVLTTLRVLGTRRDRLAGPVRTVFWVRAAADVGIVEFVTTHLASGSDDRPCDPATCPPPCVTDEMVQTCQARQVVDHIERNAHPDAVVLLGGDLNAEADEVTIEAVRDAGYRDTHLLVGNPECNADTGEQCTGGRIDDSLEDLGDPNSKQRHRIDYIWIGGTRDCTAIAPTGLFNAEAATGVTGAVVFPSDHTGVQATLECRTTDAHRRAVDNAPLPTVPPTTAPSSGPVDPETEAEITNAFETVFSGEVQDPEARLSALEDRERLREFLLETYEAIKDIAARIVVRIDSISLTDAMHADVVYSLLLDGNAVFDHIAATAVKIDDRWLVSRQTFCAAGIQGADEIPEACRG
jgi:hypothetical protein